MKFLSQTPLIGILRGADTKSVESAAEAVICAGLKTLEIALNRRDAFAQISLLKRKYGREIQLGAGTVLTAEDAEKAIDSGAEFIVTPALVMEVIETCKKNNTPVFPGAMTPSEILSAHLAGAEMVKVFPASVLGPAYIKSLRGPFPDIKLIPTGGITLESVSHYLTAGANALGVGSELFRKDWMELGNWNAIQEIAEKYIEAAQKI